MWSCGNVGVELTLKGQVVKEKKVKKTNVSFRVRNH